MGTKNNPGKFDCLEAAHPDEPFFVLIGRDRQAPDLVREWARGRATSREDRQKVEEAMACATAMERWLSLIGRERNDRLSRVLDAVEKWMAMQSTENTSALYNAAHDFLRLPYVDQEDIG